MGQNEEIVVALDVGTDEVKAFVGDIKGDGAIEVIGIGSAESGGLTEGVVTDIQTTVDAIQSAVRKAENMAGVEVRSVHLGISGKHIRGLESHGVVRVDGKEIRHEDISAVVDQAKAVAVPIDRKILHTLVREYIVDGQGGIKVPIGITGTRLEAMVFLVAVANAAMENVVRSCSKAGLAVADVVVSPIAAGMATLTKDETELGVALVDIGAGTSDILMYSKGSVGHVSVLPIGGALISDDIAVGLHTPLSAAEEIKQTYGSALCSDIPKNDFFEAPKVGSGELKKLSRQMLCDIIEARAMDIIDKIAKEIEKADIQDAIGAGIALTGGVANLEGIDLIMQDRLGLPVRVASPGGVVGHVDLIDRPEYATGVGLLHWAATHPPMMLESQRPYLSQLASKIKEWFKDRM